MELSSGEWAPCSAGFPCSVSVLGIHLCQCTSWRCCERLRSASVNFFEDSIRWPISWWVIYEYTCPHCWVFSSFWPKVARPPCPTLPIHSVSPGVTFFVYLDGKRPQRETFCRYGRGEAKKMTEALKSIKINKFKNCFAQWEKSLNRCIASNGEYFEGDWSLNM